MASATESPDFAQFSLFAPNELPAAYEGKRFGQQDEAEPYVAHPQKFLRGLPQEFYRMRRCPLAQQNPYARIDVADGQDFDDD